MIKLILTPCIRRTFYVQEPRDQLPLCLREQNINSVDNLRKPTSATRHKQKVSGTNTNSTTTEVILRAEVNAQRPGMLQSECCSL